MNCSCTPQKFVRLGLASWRSDLAVVLAGPLFPPHSQSSVVTARACVAPLRSGVAEVSPCQTPLHSLSATLSQFARFAESIDTVSNGNQDVLASAGFSAASASAPVQAPLLSATVAAMGARSRSPTPLPKRPPHRRASEPARGPVARDLSGCWERSAAQPPSCYPPLLPRVLAAHWLLDFSSHCSPVVLVMVLSPSPSSSALLFYRRRQRHWPHW